MENHKYTFENIAIRYGLMTTVGLIGYFLVMKLVGLVHITELRMLNFIFLVGGIYMAIRRYGENNESMTYLKGIAIGFLTSAVAVIPFALFIFIYLQLDQGLLNYIREHDQFGQHLNSYILSFIIGFEGFFSGMILTFIIMQYMKRSHIKGGGIN